MVELVKGKTNASVPFLNDTSTDTIIKPSMNGKQRKCCQIPHSAISKDVLQKLIERGMIMTSNINYHYLS